MLRQAILDGRLAPGERIREDEVAQRLSVSRMPIRQALRTLAQEGLAVLRPHHGAEITALSLDELEEIYAARLGLEGLAARYAALRMTPPALKRMRGMLTELDRLAKTSSADYLPLEHEYHDVCYAESGRPRLCRQVSDLRGRAERYLRTVLDSPRRYVESLEALHRLYTACERGDGDLAERGLHEALRWTLAHATPLLERYLESSSSRRA